MQKYYGKTFFTIMIVITQHSHAPGGHAAKIGTGT